MIKAVSAKLFSYFRRGPADPGAVLKSFIPRRVYMELIAECRDKRHLAAMAAKKIGKTELEVLVEIGNRAKLRVLKEVPAFSPQQGKGRFNFSDLRKAGAIPLYRASELAAFACVDPVLLARSIPESQSVPHFLAGWYMVARALDESEQSAIAAAEQERLRREDQLCSIAQGVLKLIQEEAQSFGASEVSIGVSELGGAYEFSGTDGRLARGRFEASIWEKLREQLIALKDQGNQVRIHSDRRAVITLRHQEDRPPCLPIPIPAIEHEKPPERESKVITFPREVRSQTKPVNDPDSGPVAPLSRVMVIDDNPSFCAVIERFLSREGFEVVKALSCEEALAKIDRLAEKPRIVICDLHLPGMNGLEFLKRFKGLNLEPRVPVIILTSDDDVEAELRLLSEGAELFLSKTVDPRVLSLHVRRLTGQIVNSMQGAA